jgi:hypothetical protein
LASKADDFFWRKPDVYADEQDWLDGEITPEHIEQTKKLPE